MLGLRSAVIVLVRRRVPGRTIAELRLVLVMRWSGSDAARTPFRLMTDIALYSCLVLLRQRAAQRAATLRRPADRSREINEHSVLGLRFVAGLLRKRIPGWRITVAVMVSCRCLFLERPLIPALVIPVRPRVLTSALTAERLVFRTV